MTKKGTARIWRSKGVGAFKVLTLVGFLTIGAAVWESGLSGFRGNEANAQVKNKSSAHEVVVYASELSKSALYQFDFASDPASPGGKMIFTRNKGDELDPPPERDPHVRFKVKVQRGIPYRCWIHMKVGAPMGVSQANKFWVQFSDAVDKANNEVFKPGTGSYLTAQGPTRQGWTWVGCELENAKSSESLIYFSISGEITVHMQAGMEGVGFDQFILSSSRFLEKPPSEAVVRK